MNTKLRGWLSRLFVKDYNCIVCGRELAAPGRYRLCSPCYVLMEVIGERTCLKCGKMLFAEEQYCLDCQNNERSFDRALAPFAYSGSAATLVRRLKFGRQRYLADAMANLMTDKLLEAEILADVVIPVPLSSQRQKERGFNQSELLGEVIANGLKLPLDLTSVRRVKDTLASSGLTGGRRAREENMKGAFVVTDKAAIKGNVVLAVDDVLTTGATMNELSETLKKAGAKKVVALTFATTSEKPPIQEGY